MNATAGNQTAEVDMANDGIQRDVLPIPDRRPVGLTTYDAKDPDTSFPRIKPLRPPPRRRMCWWC